MASTFSTLAKAADFSESNGSGARKKEDDEAHLAASESEKTSRKAPLIEDDHRGRPSKATFHYNIQIHLPTTTDISVYNAIFKSLRENLL